MIKIRKAQERGKVKLSWLDSKHTFSFGQYQDPDFMGYASLRVINDDHIAPGGGFATHPHNDMEIISYVLEGALEHKDNMGNGSVIRAGDVQRMSAGTGVTHSEFNPSQDNSAHFLQIWFLPNEQGLQPGYAQKAFSSDEKKGQLRLVVSNNGRDGAISLNQDVDMYATILDADDAVTHELDANRKCWIHVARGQVELNGHLLDAGDGAAVENESLSLSNANQAEVILIDMAAKR